MIAIITCGNGKQKVPAKSIDIYIGFIFRQKLTYVRTFYPNAYIYIYLVLSMESFQQI